MRKKVSFWEEECCWHKKNIIPLSGLIASGMPKMILAIQQAKPLRTAKKDLGTLQAIGVKKVKLMINA